MSNNIAPQTPPQVRAQLVAPGAPVQQRRHMVQIPRAEQNPPMYFDENGLPNVPDIGDLHPRRLWPEEEIGIPLQANVINDDFRNRRPVQIPDNWRFQQNPNQRN